MKKRFALLFAVLVASSVVGGVWLSRFSRQQVVTAQPRKLEPQSSIPEEIRGCYPDGYLAPSMQAKVVKEDYTYYFVLSDSRPPEGQTESYSNGYFLFKSKAPYVNCEEYLNSTIHTTLAKYVPFPVAVDLKEQFWKWAFSGLPEEEIEEWLNTPYNPVEPQVFLPEDVDALARLGRKPGPKAKLADSWQEAWEDSVMPNKETQKK